MDAMIRPQEFGWRAFVRYNLATDGHDLYVAYRDQNRVSWTVAPLSLVQSVGMPLDAPTLADASGWGSGPEEAPAGDTRGFLQCMVDAAWEIGIRPRRLAEHQSEIAAVRYHLEDMRKLAKVK